MKNVRKKTCPGTPFHLKIHIFCGHINLCMSTETPQYVAAQLVQESSLWQLLPIPGIQLFNLFVAHLIAASLPWSWMSSQFMICCRFSTTEQQVIASRRFSLIYSNAFHEKKIKAWVINNNQATSASNASIDRSPYTVSVFGLSGHLPIEFVHSLFGSLYFHDDSSQNCSDLHSVKWLLTQILLVV